MASRSASRQVGGQHDQHLGQQVALGAALCRHAMPLDPQLLAAGGARRNVERHRAAGRGHVDARPGDGLAQGDRQPQERSLPLRAKNGCGATWTVSIRSPAVPRPEAGSPLPRSRIFFPSSMPGGTLTTIVSVSPDWRRRLNWTLPPLMAVVKGMVTSAAPRLRGVLRRRRSAPAGGATEMGRKCRPARRPALAEALAEELAEVDVFRLESAARAAPQLWGLRAPLAHGLEGTAVAVVHFPLFRAVEDVEGGLDRLELFDGRRFVRVHVGMVFRASSR